jgi:hypothetical protein
MALAEFWFPRVFEVSYAGDEVCYEFASAHYAAAFAQLNDPESIADAHGPGLALALVREGWRCHRFPGTDFIVVLPHDFSAAFDAEGVLMGTLDGEQPHFSATLHREEVMATNPRQAYRFLDHLANKAQASPVDKGTYRYFQDPNKTGTPDFEYTFYVIAVPGAVVVISLASPPALARPAALARIENAVPDLIGELA